MSICFKVQQIYERQIEEYENKLRNPTPEERKRRDKWLISKMENLVLLHALKNTIKHHKKEVSV